jgi:PhzF family phenazine biosynthesis protein
VNASISGNCRTGCVSRLTRGPGLGTNGHPVPEIDSMTQRKCRLFVVDSFTRNLFCGNPAVVVLDAEQLTNEEMLQITREVAGSEVAFVLESDSADYDIELRFFSPRREMAFVGHATVAAHYARAIADGKPEGRVRQKSGPTIVEVEVTGEAPALSVTIHQSPASFGPTLVADRRSAVLDALGISSDSLHPECPIQVMTQASSRLMIGLRSPETLESLQPQMDTLMHLTSHVGADGFFVFGLLPDSDPVSVEARMFCPALGIPEDAVSGNATGMLGVFLVKNGLLPVKDGNAHLIAHQGRFVNRPGRVDVGISASGKRATEVRVTGDAVVFYQAALEIP